METEESDQRRITGKQNDSMRGFLMSNQLIIADDQATFLARHGIRSQHYRSCMTSGHARQKIKKPAPFQRDST
jgi:hypothetical protein